MRISDQDLRRLRDGDSVVARARAPVLQRCARAGCRKAGLQADVDLADEVQQELWMLLVRDGERRFDTAYNLEPWLIESARRLALAAYRRTHPRQEARLDVGVDMDGDEDPMDAASGPPKVIDEWEDQAIDNIDRQRALEYLRRTCNKINAMHFVSTDHLKMPVPAELPDIGQSPRPPAKSPQKSPIARELRQIRKQLGMTQEEMASALGVRVPAYQAYEYGRVRSVPQEIIDGARLLKEDKDYSYAFQKFGGRMMSDILKDWAARLGCEPTEITRLALLLGTNKASISRWASNRSRPDPGQLLRIESIVEQAAQRLARSKAAIERIERENG